MRLIALRIYAETGFQLERRNCVFGLLCEKWRHGCLLIERVSLGFFLCLCLAYPATLNLKTIQSKLW